MGINKTKGFAAPFPVKDPYWGGIQSSQRLLLLAGGQDVYLICLQDSESLEFESVESNCQVLRLGSACRLCKNRS